MFRYAIAILVLSVGAFGCTVPSRGASVRTFSRSSPPSLLANRTRASEAPSIRANLDRRSGGAIRLAKGQMLVVHTPRGTAILEFTAFRDSEASYRWRARSSTGHMGRGVGTVFERYIRSSGDSNQVQLTDNGSERLVGAGLFTVQWSYADLEGGWLYLDSAIGDAQVESSVTFDQHPLRR